MPRKISSGVDFLDLMLGGGLETDAITTVFGPAGVGKTNLALLAAVATAKKGKKVCFIDTEGGFSVTRLRQLVKNPKSVLQNIFFMRPTTFAEQQKAVEKLSDVVTKKNISLIVFDTLTMLYRLERKGGDEFFEMTRDLSTQLAKLMEVTRKKNIPVLMTNQVYNNFQTGNVKMVGGDTLNYCSKVLLELQPAGQYRKLILRKHRNQPLSAATFKIVESGLEEVEKRN